VYIVCRSFSELRRSRL